MSPLKQDGQGGLTAVMSRLGMFMGFGAMIVVVISQGSGLALGSALKSFQGSFSIVLVGTVIVTIVTVLKNGMRARGMHLSVAAVSTPEVWREGLRSLRWSLFTRGQRDAIFSLAVTSALINLGGVVAVRELGNGVNAAFSTAGALAAGALLLRFAPQWLLRFAVLTAVVFAAIGTGQGNLSLLGLVAALCAASHMWNLPKRVVRLGDKSDEGLTWANLISAPPVLIGTFWWDHSQGVSWEWGGKEIFGAVCAGLLVMVIPVFLQNWAGSRGVSEQDMGALSSLSSPLHAVVGVVLAPVTLALTGKEPVLPTFNQWGFFIIVAAVAIIAPQLPKDNRWKIQQAGPGVAVREDDEACEQPPVPHGDLDEQPQAPLVEPKNPWVPRQRGEEQSTSRTDVEHPVESGVGGSAYETPAWAVAQGANLDPDEGKLILTPRGRTVLTEEGVHYPGGCSLTYRKGNLSVEVEFVDEGTFDVGAFVGLRATGITVVIGGTEMRYPDAEKFSVDLRTGRFHVTKPGDVLFGGRAAE
ncbi:hypothetical protein [Actinomadura mexicana]|uniref:Threonine/homoserine efflux transporter RhtA n=1 Tax=Actinomadura mexicana TaxID=134959 RepID=A0A238WXH7_9ACTN|nr:hypothetical protein [Actinomadura mexicana]SNR51212.1 Threonine/homoserine efflux transporter RhtA [Actinomadura mexicana]